MSNGEADYLDPIVSSNQSSSEQTENISVCPSNQDSRALLEVAIRATVDIKSFDVRALDMRNLVNFTDYYLVSSATSLRHAQGIADNIIKQLKSKGVKPLTITGYDNSEWIVIDYGDLVAHIFYEPSRQYYDFDALWSAASVIQFDTELEKQVRHLRSGRFR